MIAERLLYVLWILRLFKPEWVLSYYVPGASFLKSGTTLLLYGLFAYLMVKGHRIRVDKTLLLFSLSILASTLFAVNTGLARGVLFGFVDTMIFLSINATVIKEGHQIKKILWLYLGSLAVYAIPGVIFGGRVPFHVFLSDEDAFGPFMDLGIPLCYFLAQTDQKARYKYVLVGLMCSVGLVASFARGAFLAFCGALVFIWLQSPRKLLMALAGVGFGIFFAISATLLFGGAKYWEEMASIDESLHDEKKDGRHWLIEKAFMMYFENSVIGVGPRNYGPALTRASYAQDAEKRTGWQLAQLYTRVPHNIYLQVLTELGSVGALCFVAMIYAALRRNIRVQREFLRRRSKMGDASETSSLEQYYYYSLALNGATIVFLMNGLFYDILYYHWFYDFLILGYVTHAQFHAHLPPSPVEGPRNMGLMSEYAHRSPALSSPS